MIEELIARLEAAEGPDTALDAAVALAAGYTTYPDGYGDGNEWVDPQGNHLPRAVRMGAQPPKFTASIDAALTLVPEGWGWRVEKVGNGPSRAIVGGSIPQPWLDCATPAIAICIAALYAMQINAPCR